MQHGEPLTVVVTASLLQWGIDLHAKTGIRFSPATRSNGATSPSASGTNTFGLRLLDLDDDGNPDYVRRGLHRGVVERTEEERRTQPCGSPPQVKTINP